jgi:hypothetical protein
MIYLDFDAAMTQLENPESAGKDLALFRFWICEAEDLDVTLGYLMCYSKTEEAPGLTHVSTHLKVGCSD